MVTKTNDMTATVREDIPHDHLFTVTGLSSTNMEKFSKDPPHSDFEEAIAATGYGRFNIILMLCSLPGFWSACSVTSAISYIFTRAQCDMNLSLLDMGTVSAMTYGGMISSAMLWGFLSDTLGRRKIMVWGFLGAGVVEMTAAMSQNFAMILVLRFASGFLFNGPFAVLISYIAELHRTELRARVILLTSLFYTFANTTLPLLAWAFLTHEWNFRLLGDTIVIHSWNLFLLTAGLVPFITGLSFICLPESPKFLMSRGRNGEAMAVFKKIFVMNTGKSADEYPIKSLVEERTEQQGRGVAALRGGAAQLKPLFTLPHVKWLLLMCIIHSGFMLGSNTLRLWYPQLAAMLQSGEGTGGLCSAISPTTAPDADIGCVPIETDMMTYLQSVAVGAGSVLTYSIGGVIVNKCGKKLVVSFCVIASAAIVIMLPFLGNSSAAVMAMMTTALAFTSLSAASLSSICVDLFPTSLSYVGPEASVLISSPSPAYARHPLRQYTDYFHEKDRVMALATFLMSGRMGTITGTVAFPALMSYGCYPPFIAITSILTVCGLACWLVPDTTLKKLE